MSTLQCNLELVSLIGKGMGGGAQPPCKNVKVEITKLFLFNLSIWYEYSCRCYRVSHEYSVEFLCVWVYWLVGRVWERSSAQFGLYCVCALQMVLVSAAVISLNGGKSGFCSVGVMSVGFIRFRVCGFRCCGLGVMNFSLLSFGYLMYPSIPQLFYMIKTLAVVHIIGAASKLSPVFLHTFHSFPPNEMEQH